MHITNLYNKENNKGWRLLLLAFLCLGVLWASSNAAHATPPISGNTIEFADSGQNLGNSNSFDVALGDLDGDGDLDAFVANDGGQSNKVWINVGGVQGGTPGTFGDSGQSLGSSNSIDAALGDLDGDGDLDAFVANYAGQPNKVWTNNGGIQGGTPGTFSDSGQSLGSSNSYDVALGDLDSDGDLDAFIANYGQPNKVWINNGGVQGGTPGTFSDSGQSLGSSNSMGAVLGDLDSDGDLDAFVANYVGQPNKVWINNGGAQGGTLGIFSDSGQSLGNDWSIGLVLGDLDGDGDLDAFIANYGQPDSVWINNGGVQGGTLGTFSDSGQSLGSSNSFDVALGDLDGDGDLDAFVANNGGQPDTVWTNNGGVQGGTLGTFSDSGQSLGSSNSFDAALGDLDGDGDLDAFVVNNGQADKVWRNDAVHRNMPFDGSGSNVGTSTALVNSVAVGDLDNDGDLDLVGGGGTQLYAYQNDGTPFGATWTQLNVGSTTDGIYEVALGDLDLDGDLDITVATRRNEDYEVIAWENVGTPFTAWTQHDLGTRGDDEQGLALGDLDNDGDLDIVTTGRGSSNVNIWQNDGTPFDNLWAKTTVGTITAEGRSAALGDLDNDGDLDIVVGGFGSQVYAWQNDGTPFGGAWTGQLVGTTEAMESVTVSDLDNDGYLDIVSGAFTPEDYEVVAWQNDGTPFDAGWTSQDVGASSSDVYAVRTADLDGDGFQEIISANTGGQVTVWQNDNTPFDSLWTEQPVGSSTATVNWITPADLDSDGDIDLVTASSNGEDYEVIAWQNQGGSAGIAVTDTSPAGAVPLSSEDDLLNVVFSHNGISGDHDLELNLFNLDLLRSDCSTPLTTSEANALIDNLRVRLDDGDDVFETSDALVADVATLSLTGGVQTISFTNDDTNVQAAVSGSQTYWISILTTADAGTQSPNELCLNFDPDADALVEGKGSADFSVSLQDTGATNTGAVTFPPPATVAINDVSLTEGDSGTTSFAFTVSRSSNDATFSVDFATANGTATTADLDYVANSNTINFTSGGSLAQQVTVQVNGDTAVETDETFFVNLSNVVGYATLSDSQGQGTIQNDDASIAIAATDADKAEGDSGNTAFTFTVTRNGDTSGASSADYAVTGSGANPANAADFGGNLPSGTVNFAATETSKVITVNVSGDTLAENDETFTVTLSNPSGTTIGTATAGGTIQNDDTNVSIAATDADKAEGDSGNTAFTFTVTRSGITSGASAVDYAVTGSGANPADAADYGGSLPSGTVNFASSETSQVITINVSGDMVAENDETFTVTLTNPSGTTIDTNAADGTIQNDDTAAITLTESGGATNITEGGSTDSYTLVLTSQPTADVTVTITPDAQTDLGNGAGTAITLTFTDSDWDTAQTVMVTAVDDQSDEGSHSSTLSHSAASSDANYDGLTIVDVTVTIADNDTAGIMVTETDGDTAVAEGGATDTLEVVLQTQPDADVIVTLTPDSQVQLSDSSLTFTSVNWDTPQTVTVTAVDDGDSESDHQGNISFSVSSSDPNYDGMVMADVTVEISDNDIFYVFLPMVVNNQVTAPDLVVKEILVTGNSVEVTIENQGTAPTAEDFWADLYIDPSQAPTAVNQTWDTLSNEGMVWGVTQSIGVGETLVLTLNGPYYDAARSSFSGTIPAGTQIYVQVDSFNLATAYGAINKVHEQLGTAYNNISSTTASATIVVMNAAEATAVRPQNDFLPTR